MEQTKQAKQSQQDTDKAKQPTQDVPLVVAPFDDEKDKQSEQGADLGKQSTQDVPLVVASVDDEQAKEYQEACAKRLKTTVEVTNKIGMKLRLIPPGEFLMGSPRQEKNRERYEETQHRVRLTQAFYLSATEVTQQQYQQIMGDNPSTFSAANEGEEEDAFINVDTGQHPVESVSWFDAVKFCNLLSEREGLKPYYHREGESVDNSVTMLGGNGYRLPTEAEWEYACRAGTSTAYHSGDDPVQLGDYAWFDANLLDATHPGGQKKSNAFGLYDMHGNVWEWCQSWYAPYSEGDQAVDDPSPDKGVSRVLRGGSFINDARYVRSANRSLSYPFNRSYDYGFRVARTYP